MADYLKVFFDGGWRSELDTMEAAVVAVGRTTMLRDLGPGSSMEAEWLALIHALTVARSLGRNFVLLGDAADVVAKVNGEMKCRGASAEHLETFRSLAGAIPPRVRWIKRSQNLAGIALARLDDR